MKNIAVVTGGYSKEAEISEKSGEQIIEALDGKLFVAYLVIITKNRWVVKVDNREVEIDKNDFSFINNGKSIKFDAVFMAIHGTPGEDGKLQSYFEMLNVPVTTSNSFVSSLTFNKFAVKAYLKEFGVLSAKSVVLHKGDSYSAEEIVKELGLPVFVKPNNGGSSFGVTKVKEQEDLSKAIEKAFVEDSEVIIEEFIDGREFTCGYFESKDEEISLPVTEIISKTEFFDYEAKYKGLSEEVTPAEVTKDIYIKIQSLTRKIYRILKCAGVVRIDFLLREGDIYFMEVNTVPGMSKESIIPQQVRVAGLSVTRFYTELINDAIKRTGRD